MAQPHVLLYNFEMNERTKQIRRYLNKRKVKVCFVDVADYAQPLGVLCELPGFARIPLVNLGGNFQTEMMVMQGFSEEELDAFLTFFREQGIEPVSLKAVLTVITQHWTSLQLHDHLKEEQAQMK